MADVADHSTITSLRYNRLHFPFGPLHKVCRVPKRVIRRLATRRRRRHRHVCMFGHRCNVGLVRVIRVLVRRLARLVTSVVMNHARGVRHHRLGEGRGQGTRRVERIDRHGALWEARLVIRDRRASVRMETVRNDLRTLRIAPERVRRHRAMSLWSSTVDARGTGMPDGRPLGRIVSGRLR